MLRWAVIKCTCVPVSQTAVAERFASSLTSMKQ